MCGREASFRSLKDAAHLVITESDVEVLPMGTFWYGQQWRIQDFWMGGGAPVWKVGGGGGGRQVKWQSRLWVEIEKIGIACPK